MMPVSGTPRWAVVAAWLTPLCLLPSGVWRTLVGLGVPLGWSQAHLDAEQIPGPGTGYVILLTVASLAAASLTLGLVYPWGDRIAGRRTPTALVVALAGVGALAVAYLVLGSILNWDRVSGFADRPESGWAQLMIACYLPTVLWPPLLIAVTVAFVRRRLRVAPSRA